jgi:hypothetical protein
MIFVGTMVMALSVSTIAVAADGVPQRTAEHDSRSCGIAEGPDECGAPGHVGDQERGVAVVTATSLRSDIPIYGTSTTTRTEDRVTDRRRDGSVDRPSDRPPWSQVLRRCLSHHLGDAQLPMRLTERELFRLLPRCLWHHLHPGVTLQVVEVR